MAAKKASYILAIDQGTTSSRAIIFDAKQKIVAVGQKEFTQHFPKSGWVEHDPKRYGRAFLRLARAAIRKAQIKSSDIAAIGITNQRETTVVWDRKTGKPVTRRLSGRTGARQTFATSLKKAGHEKTFTAKTGLSA